MWQRCSLWRAGSPSIASISIPERVALVAKHALGQARMLSQAYPGVMHAIMFWGFLALFMGTVLATIDYDITLPLFGYKLLKGHFYLFYETVLDLFGLFFVIGLGMAVWRRFVLRPARIDPTARFADVLALLFVINVTGFIMEACRLAVVQPAWAPWSPVGWALGQAMLGVGHVRGRAAGDAPGVWLFHAAISLAFIAIVPYSYFVHLLTTPLNIFFSKLDAARGHPHDREHRGGRRRSASPSSRSSRGSGGWTSMPAWSAGAARTRVRRTWPGTALSPKQIIVKLKRHLHGELPGPIHGELIKPDELWACTTCMACVQECPAFIDIVDTIIDLRRYLALSEGALALHGAAVAAEHPARRQPVGLAGRPSAWPGPRASTCR